jgi:hypothetical protein
MHARTGFIKKLAEDIVMVTLDGMAKVLQY